jgi:hypothetical protein
MLFGSVVPLCWAGLFAEGMAKSIPKCMPK